MLSAREDAGRNLGEAVGINTDRGVLTHSDATGSVVTINGTRPTCVEWQPDE